MTPICSKFARHWRLKPAPLIFTVIRYDLSATAICAAVVKESAGNQNECPNLACKWQTQRSQFPLARIKNVISDGNYEVIPRGKLPKICGGPRLCRPG